MKRGASALLALLVAGCSGPAKESLHRARLEVQWTAADTGKAARADSGRLAGAAVAEWCGDSPMLEITAAQGDSGVGLLLYPVDTVRPDSYPLLPPERADSNRPAGALALRWFGETAVKGYQSDSGSVIVTRSADGRLAGRFSAGLLSATDASRLHATGTFKGLTVVPATRGCPPRVSASQPDTGVH